LEREWVKVVGHKEVPGRPALYGSTKQFLDYFNLKSLNELPTLAELTDLDQQHPELDLPAPEDEEAPAQLKVVTESGEIVEPNQTRH
jgi:segregation and condensation protein B